MSQEDALRTENAQGILVIVDVVDYTPQTHKLGAQAAADLTLYLEKELKRRGEPLGFKAYKSAGDAVFLFHPADSKCEDGLHLLTLANELMGEDPLPKFSGYDVKVRMVAHTGAFVLTMNQEGLVTDLNGGQAIFAFRSEKLADVYCLLVSEALYSNVGLHLKKFNFTHDEAILDKPLKGLEKLGAGHVFHKLRPKRKSDDRDARMPNAYKERREQIQKQVAVIPVFGGIYNDIQMEDNFIRLRFHSLTGRLSGKQAGSEKADRDPEFQHDRHVEMASKSFERFDSRDLFGTFSQGVLYGLPGAGKTTVLRNFAYEALKRDAKCHLLLINCRDLQPGHLEFVKEFDEREPNPIALLPALVAAFLFPGEAVTKADKKIISQTAQELAETWQEKELLVLVDALDEAPSDFIQREVIKWTRAFCKNIPESVEPNGGNNINRFYLTSRIQLRSEVGLDSHPVFEVESLDQGDLQALARGIFDARNRSDLADRFVKEIPDHPAAVRLGGTPLTALLLLFYYEAEGKFELRFATYEIILKFILMEVWKDARVRQTERKFRDLKQFFAEARATDWKKKHPEAALQHAALAQVGWKLLYAQDGVDRQLTGISLENEFVRFIRSPYGGKKTEGTARKNAKKWVKKLVDAHLLLHEGRDTLVFIHSTVLEFYAALYIHAQGWKPADLRKAALAKGRETLETFPILCGIDWRKGHKVIQLLEEKCDPPPPLNLMFRCLAETEYAEHRALLPLIFEEDRKPLLSQMDKASPKNVVYQELGRLLWEEAPAKVRATTQDLAGQLPLIRDVFPSKQGNRKGLRWDEKGGSDELEARRQFLHTILHRNWHEQWVEVRRPEADAKQTQGSVLMLDLPGDLEDKNFAYYRDVAVSISETDGRPMGAGKTLRGLLGSPNFKHAGPITCLAMHPSKPWVLSGASDRTLKVWDVESGREVRTLNGHKGGVRACAWSGDGQRVLSGADDSTLKVWDVESGREVQTLNGHKGRVWACAWSGDGQRVLSGADDSTLKVWDVESGREVRTLNGHKGGVWACAWSRDGQRVLSGASDRTLKVWDVESGREVQTLNGHLGGVRACAWSGDGQRVLSGADDRTLKVWDVESGREVRTLNGHKGVLRACAWSGDGQRVLSGADDRTLKVWDVESGREVRTLNGHQGWVWACAWSRDGQRVLSGASDRTLKVWDVGSGREVRTLNGHQGWVWACAWSGDGQRVLSGADDSTLKVWDVGSGREVRTLSGHQGRVRACAWSRDGQRVLSGADDSTLKIWDVESGREVRTLNGHQGWVWACAWSGDGQRVLSGAEDRTLKVWDVESGREVRTLNGHKGRVWACAWSGDGKRVLSGAADCTLKVWDVESGREVRTLNGHKGGVRACAWIGDGKRVLSGASDRTLKVWDVESGRILRHWSLPAQPFGISVNPVKPEMIAVVMANGVVMLFDIEAAP